MKPPNPYRPDRDVIASVAAKQTRDLLNKAGAVQLAQDLDAWWHARGYFQVRHWPEYILCVRPRQGQKKTDAPKDDDRRTGAWAVRSNLVNGLPPAS